MDRHCDLWRRSVETIAIATLRIESRSYDACNGRCWCVALTHHLADLETPCFSIRNSQKVQLKVCIIKRRHGGSLETAIRGELKSTMGTSYQSHYRDFTVPPVDMTSFDCPRSQLSASRSSRTSNNAGRWTSTPESKQCSDL